MFLFDMVLSSWVSYPFCVYSRQSLNLYFSFRDFDFGENVAGRIYISRKSLFWRFTEKRREKEEKEREEREIKKEIFRLVKIIVKSGFLGNEIF